MPIPTESSPPPGWDARGLDVLLDMFPRGQLSEIVGGPSSGSSSLLLALLARATSAGGLVALVDWGEAFDPAVAKAAGADLLSILWVRCSGQLDPALRAADLLARCPGFAIVALDLGELPARYRHPISHAMCVRLQRAAESSGAALVLRAPHHLTGSAAALVVSARRVRTQWLRPPRPTRLGGVLSEIGVLHCRGSLPGGGLGHGTSWTIEWQL